MIEYTVKEVVSAAVATSLLATVLIGLLASAPAAQEQPPARVFTVEQAAAGKTAFERSCAACHMHNLSGDADAPALAGTSFMSTWRTRSTRDLLQYMSTSMPPGSASLDNDVYTSIAAYVLKFNGATAGPDRL